MEILTYILVYIFSLFFIFTSKALNKKFGFYFWIFSTTLLSVSLRLKLDPLSDSDMGNYIRLMSSDIDLLYLNREFMFYGTSRLLYSFCNSEFIVFIFWDLVIFFSYYFACVRLCNFFLKNSQENILNFILFSSILFFPFVLGLHTIYRQLIAAVIFMNSFASFLEGKKLKGFIFFFISFFIHNSCFLFLPIFLITYENKFIKIISIIILILTSYFIFTVINSTNELLYRDFQTNVSGPHITRMYILSLCFLILLVLVFETFITKFKYISILVYLLLMSIIYISSVIAYSSGMSERVVVFLYTIFYPIFTTYIYSIFKEKKTIMVVYLHISLLPIILLHNSTIDLSLTF